MNEDDLCVYREGNHVKACGWSINSKLLCNDIPLAAYQRGGGDNKKGGGSALQNLAIPAGLILLQNSIDSHTSFKNIIEEPKIIGEDLYNKLLNLSEKKKRILFNTRKYRKKGKNKTRKKK